MNGDILIFLGAVLWSLFPIFTKLSYADIPPLYAAALSTFFSMIFFAAMMTWQNRWHELKKKEAYKDIALGTLYIGIIMYALMFIGLKYTTAGNASLIGILEVFASFIILGLLKKEKITKRKVLGAMIMALGAVLVVLPNTSGLRAGDFILLAALVFAPLGNMHQQAARKKVSSFTMMFIRSLVSSAAIFALALIFSPMPRIISNVSLIYLALSGLLFMGLSKIFWIEGINKIEITRANSISMVGPFFTLAFAFFILGEVPHLGQLLGMLPLMVGAYLILAK